MDQPSKRDRKGLVGPDFGSSRPVQQEFVRAPEPSYNQGVKLRSVFPAKIKAVGPVTGKAYVWNAAGDVAIVDPVDVDGLLAKRVGSTSCCGPNADGNRVFERV